MTMTRLEEITGEVIRRLALLTAENRGLLLLSGGVEHPGLRQHLEELEREGYVFTQLMRKNEDVCPWVRTVHRRVESGSLGDEEALVSLVSGQDEVVVSGMTLAQAAALRELRLEGIAAKLICEALRQGKAVRVFSGHLELHAASPGFGGQARRLLAELEAWGIQFPGSAGPNGVRLEKAMLTRQDLKNVLEGPVIVDRKTTLTTSAKLLLEERGIAVLRQ